MLTNKKIGHKEPCPLILVFYEMLFVSMPLDG